MNHRFFKGVEFATLYARDDDVPFTPKPSDT